MEGSKTEKAGTNPRPDFACTVASTNARHSSAERSGTSSMVTLEDKEPEERSRRRWDEIRTGIIPQHEMGGGVQEKQHYKNPEGWIGQEKKKSLRSVRVKKLSVFEGNETNADTPWCSQSPLIHARSRV